MRYSTFTTCKFNKVILEVTYKIVIYLFLFYDFA